MDVRPASRLAEVPVRLESGDGGLGVPGRKSTLVLADDVGLVHIGIWLQDRWAVEVAAGQCPPVVVKAQLDDAGVVASVGGDGNGNMDSPVAAVDCHEHLFDAATRG